MLRSWRLSVSIFHLIVFAHPEILVVWSHRVAFSPGSRSFCADKGSVEEKSTIINDFFFKYPKYDITAYYAL